jgi:hypothetical protein
VRLSTRPTLTQDQLDFTPHRLVQIGTPDVSNISFIPSVSLICTSGANDVRLDLSSLLDHDNPWEDVSISICLKNSSGQCAAWTGTGWLASAPGQLDRELSEVLIWGQWSDPYKPRLIDIWRRHHSSWALWPGTYEVQVALSNACSSWVPIVKTITVTQCRQGEFKHDEVTSNEWATIYPNPAFERVNIRLPESLINDGYEIPFTIYSLSGQLLEQGVISDNNFIDLSRINQGIHILKLELPNGLMQTERLSVIK